MKCRIKHMKYGIKLDHKCPTHCVCQEKMPIMQSFEVMSGKI